MNRIEKCRKEKGLDQKQLAKHIGITQQSISLYETGKREPRKKTWQKLASFFNVSVPYLQGLTPYRTQNVKYMADKRDIKQVETFLLAMEYASKEQMETIKEVYNSLDKKQMSFISDMVSRFAILSFLQEKNVTMQKDYNNIAKSILDALDITLPNEKELNDFLDKYNIPKK